jgi:ankyrin repeat protein
MIAARHGHVALVDRLLAVPDIDDSLPYNGEFDAMMTATKNGHLAVIQRLLERPLVPVYSVRRSMEIAASTNRLDLLKPLMISSHLRNNRQRRQAKGKAFLAALYAGHEDIVDFLMRDGFVRSYHVNAKDRDGCTPLMKICIKGHTEPVARLLTDPGLRVNDEDTLLRVPGLRNNDLDALMKICIKGHTELVARLLKVPGLRVNEVDGHNKTALRHALTNSRSEIVDLLLRKPDIKIPDDIMSHCWNDACKLVVSRAILKKNLLPEITRGCLFGRTKTGAPLPTLPTEMERMIASYLLPTKEADVAVRCGLHHNDEECEECAEEIDDNEEVVLPPPCSRQNAASHGCKGREGREGGRACPGGG